MSVNIGQTVWFHNGGENNPLVEGKVIHIFRPEGYCVDQYVIEVPTCIEPLLYVRDYDTMSLTETGPLNIWKRNRK